METYRTFHRGFVVYSMWTDTCEEQCYAQKEKRAFHCCFCLPPRQRLRMRISNKFFLFVLRSNKVEHISKNIVPQVITKSLRFHTNKKNFLHRLKVTQSSLTIFGWVLSFPELCLIRNFVWQNLCLGFSKSGLPWLPSHQRVIQH